MNTIRLDLYKIIGVSYLTDAITAAINVQHRDEMFRVYVTDRLYSLCAFTGNIPSMRYYDILHPEPEDPRSGMEIAVDLLESLGIKVVE